MVVKNLRTGKNIRLQSKVVLDASGFLAIIRRKLPPQMGIETLIANEDVEICYREIRQINREIDDPTFCDIYLDHTITPGGYTWIFPRGKSQVNVGLGVSMTDGFPNPKHIFDKYVLSKPLFNVSFRTMSPIITVERPNSFATMFATLLPEPGIPASPITIFSVIDSSPLC